MVEIGRKSVERDSASESALWVAAGRLDHQSLQGGRLTVPLVLEKQQPRPGKDLLARIGSRNPGTELDVLVYGRSWCRLEYVQRAIRASSEPQ